MPPPAIRLQDIPEPMFRGSTNNDLMLYIQDLRDALNQSNKDKAAIRLFYDDRSQLQRLP
jgi:hypothetical protein